ncbi:MULTISPECIES: lipid-A-disaccharide synthase [Helicobacter]|uniref:Lipid-A-disaccharide synthase n=1 Tax=Helicobacter ibis TaxID=2962633 RepID=A0ABT4VC48_9HELI|nr:MULTISPECIES: lipid-A-disaccharide synthase [Helicobacter]MDA3967530.1 lipid-A-disaccharide synthase [Helicobacter sp. WB40]MDA3968278.1 lipid-A-disaccharide synthase [Helicobacter ibis]
MSKKIFISAIEYSANIHALKLIQSLKDSNLDFEIFGIFDEKIINKKSQFSPNDFRIMGFSGIIKLIPKYFKIKNQLTNLATKCDVAIFIDSSSFNIPIIKNMQNKTNTKIIYYILPQVWAWKRYRAKLLSKLCDELWGIIPFEKDYYPQDSNISYVGHPLLDEIPYSNTNKQNTNKIALMPGSRKGEIKNLFSIFKEVSQKIPNKKFILIAPKSFQNRDLNKIYGEIDNIEISFDPYTALKECEFAFVCSGTATLETTLLGIPTILAYKTRVLDFLIARSLVKLKFVGLANIFLSYKYHKSINNTNIQAPIHPEFLQFFDAQCLLDAYYNFDYDKFFKEKESLISYLEHGSAKICTNKLQNFYKNK